MKKIVFLICSLILLTLFFVGCFNTPKVKEYRGTYTYGHEVEIFKDEKTGQEYWLTGDVEKLNKFMGNLIIKKHISYPEVLLEIQGEDLGKATNGLAEENDRVLKVIKWKLIEQDYR